MTEFSNLKVGFTAEWVSRAFGAKHFLKMEYYGCPFGLHVLQEMVPP